VLSVVSFPLICQGGQTAAVWYVECYPDRKGWGPYEGADACRMRLDFVRETCANPLLGKNLPNPRFVQMADVCQEALNGRWCACVFREISPAKP
jgi:hypothetical protein